MRPREPLTGGLVDARGLVVREDSEPFREGRRLRVPPARGLPAFAFPAPARRIGRSGLVRPLVAVRMEAVVSHETLFGPVQCSICGRSFRRAGLRGHIRMTHPTGDEAEKVAAARAKAAATRAARKAARRAEWLASIEPELAVARAALEELGSPNPALRSVFVYEKTAVTILETTVTRLRRLGLPVRAGKNPLYPSKPARLYAIVDLARAKRERLDDLRKRPRRRRIDRLATPRCDGMTT